MSSRERLCTPGLKTKKQNPSSLYICVSLSIYICLCVCVCVYIHIYAVLSRSVMSDRLFVTLCTLACQAPLSMRFPRQEYWSGLPCPPPGDLPNPVVQSMSTALADCLFAIWATREAQYMYIHICIFLAMLQDLWDLSSLIRSWTLGPGSESAEF